MNITEEKFGFVVHSALTILAQQAKLADCDEVRMLNDPEDTGIAMGLSISGVPLFLDLQREEQDFRIAITDESGATMHPEEVGNITEYLLDHSENTPSFIQQLYRSIDQKLSMQG